MIPLSNRQAEFLSYITGLERAGHDIRFNKDFYVLEWVMKDLKLSPAMAWHMVHTLKKKGVLYRTLGVGNSAVYDIIHHLEDGIATTEWPRKIHRTPKLLPECLPFYRHPYFSSKNKSWGGGRGPGKNRKSEKRKIRYAGSED
jgi:hypothetical protein